MFGCPHQGSLQWIVDTTLPIYGTDLYPVGFVPRTLLSLGSDDLVRKVMMKVISSSPINTKFPMLGP